MEVLAKFARLHPRAIAGLCVAVAFLWVCGTAQAQGSLEYFLTLKYGMQDPSKTNDSAIESLESRYGELQGDRVVDTYGLELDIMVFPSSQYGVGLGLEYHVYERELQFNDASGVLPNESLLLKGKAFLYILKFYRQTGFLLNYFGIGSGNYFLRYNEQRNDRVFRGSSEEVFTARVGTRMEFGEWSVVLEYGETRAPETLFFLVEQPELELGGRFWNFGLGYAF